jgi:hypothetical protein
MTRSGLLANFERKYTACRRLCWGWTGIAFGRLLYSRWKTSVIGLCSGRTTLTIMVPSAESV